MKKVITAIVLSLTMVVLAGCASEKPQETPADKGEEAVVSEESETEETGNASEETASGVFKEGYKIGLSLPTLEFMYFTRMQEGFVKSCEERGIEYTYSDAGLDAAKQVADCEDMISQGVDAVLLSTWWPDAMGGVIQDLSDAGIAVILLDASNPPEADYVTNVGSDNYVSGYMGGIWTGNYLKEKEGKEEINYLEFVQASEEGRNRADGFHDGLTDSGLTINLLNSYDAPSRETSMANGEDALVTYAQIDLIFGACAQGSLGAFDACTAAQRTEVKVVGYDCEDEEMQYIEEEGSRYLASVRQYPMEMVERSMEALEEYLGGVTLEKQIPFDNGLYTCEGEYSFDDIRESYGVEK